VKLSRLNKMLVGILIIIAGIGLFFDSLGLIDFTIFDLWPLVLLYFGMRLWTQEKRIFGGLLFGLGILIISENWLDVGFDQIVPLLLIYLGFRMIRSRKHGKKMFPDVEQLETSGERQQSEGKPDAKAEYATKGEYQPKTEHAAKADDQAKAEHTADQPWKEEAYRRARMRMESAFRPGGILSPKDSRSSLIGDFHLTSGRFELQYLHIWHGIGNVVIDLSRALIQQEEAFLVVDGWIGDVTIYVPVDLPVAVSAEVKLGDLKILGHRIGGVQRHVVMRSDNYDHATQKVKLNISLIIGDIDVKYI
jgi:lia operon protein LiaF